MFPAIVLLLPHRLQRASHGKNAIDRGLPDVGDDRELHELAGHFLHAARVAGDNLVFF